MSTESNNSGPPKITLCPNCKRHTVVVGWLKKRLLTGVNITVYSCSNCKLQMDVRWVEDRPGKYVIERQRLPAKKGWKR